MKDFNLAPLFSFNSYSKQIKQLFLIDEPNMPLNNIKNVIEKYIVYYKVGSVEKSD
jgi:hypothetical protein